MSTEAATKHDAGKPRWSLMPHDALRLVVDVLEYGAGKYGPRNWERGMAYSRVYDAAQRHLQSWWQGNDRDAETGLHQLAQVAVDVMFLLAYQLRGVGTDDRERKSGDT